MLSDAEITALLNSGKPAKPVVAAGTAVAVIFVAVAAVVAALVGVATTADAIPLNAAP